MSSNYSFGAFVVNYKKRSLGCINKLSGTYQSSIRHTAIWKISGHYPLPFSEENKLQSCHFELIH